MPYSCVRVVGLDEKFIGYAIHNENADLRLHSPVLYWLDELDKLGEVVDGLNETEAIAPYWPDQNDPEVVALVKDPDFCPAYPSGGDPASVFRRHNEASRLVANLRARLNA